MSKVAGKFVDRKIRTSFVSILTDLVLITIKVFLASISGSLALLADAYHSLSDLVVSTVVLGGLVMRRRAERAGKLPIGTEVEQDKAVLGEGEGKADCEKKSRPPHHWFETIGAYAVSMLIMWMAYEVGSKVYSQPAYEVKNFWLVLLGVGFCIMIAYFISRLKIMVGREEGSPALLADGYHSRTDLFSSVAVFLAVIAHQIGIKLDPIVAIVIAILIGITGIELFVEAIIGFTGRERLNLASMWQRLLEPLDKFVNTLGRRMFGSEFSMRNSGFSRRIESLNWVSKKLWGTLLVFVALIYMFSGTYMLAPDETGLLLRFGKVVDDNVEAGAHYHLPVPFESVMRVQKDRVFRVEIGFRTDATSSSGSISPTLWDSEHHLPGYKKVREESLMVSGDEKIFDGSLVVHYRPMDATRHLLNVANINELVRGTAESVLREVVSTEPLDHVLTSERKKILGNVRDTLQKRLDTYDAGVEVLDTCWHDMHPPVEVLGSFRNVFSAREEMSRELNRAETHRNAALPKARADAKSKRMAAESFNKEKVLRAEGDARRFELRAKSFHNAKEVTSYRLFIETMEVGLQGQRKMIVDPKVNRGEYRLWMFAPGSEPTPAASPKPIMKDK